MKNIILVFFFIINMAMTAAQRNIDVLHYKFSIEVTDDNDSIFGVAEIKLRFLQSTGAFNLNLKENEVVGKGMKIDKITGTSIQGFAKIQDGITVFLNPALQPSEGDTIVYTIYYRGIPADGLIISKNKYGKRTFFADNWPNRARHWLPCVDEPGDKAAVEFIVTAPDHYQVISNGVKIEERNLGENKKLTHWKEDVPLPTKVMVIGVADFAIDEVGSVNNNIPVSSWVYPENKDKGFYDYAIGKDILAFYINYIGPYAYKKLANVQSKTRFGGMENASAIFHAEETVTGNRDEERLFAHEIVHQWFGNMATEKDFSHFWLSEGFATYLSYVYLETKHGASFLQETMKQDRQQVLGFVSDNKRPVVDTTTNYMSLLNANSYQKGGWILHMLRRQLGDSIFKKGIRAYYATYAGKNAETKDLQYVFEKVSGKNLQSFFQQWLYTNENPQFEILWKLDAVKKQLVVTVNQLQEHLFTTPLELKLAGAKTGVSKNVTLNISKQKEEFRILATGFVGIATADPNVSLLAELSLRQVK